MSQVNQLLPEKVSGALDNNFLSPADVMEVRTFANKKVLPAEGEIHTLRVATFDAVIFVVEFGFRLFFGGPMSE